MENEPTREETINLRDLVGIFWKRKWFIAVLTLAFGLAALGLSLAKPKIYRISTSLQIGTIVKDSGTPQLIESAGQIKEKKENDVYGVQARDKLGVSQSQYPNIVTQIGKDTAVISFSTESPSVDLAKKVLQEINRIIIAEHQRIYDSIKDEFQENIAVEQKNIERLKSKIGLLESETAAIQNKIDFLEKISAGKFDSGNEMIILNAEQEIITTKQDIEDAYSNINESKRSIANLKSSLDIMQPTQVIKAPYSSDAPVSSRTGINMILALLAGFLVGVFAALLIEFWNKPQNNQ
jgi:uncharacterized protein involved in exopolysaccharide biosynthesis